MNKKQIIKYNLTCFLLIAGIFSSTLIAAEKMVFTSVDGSYTMHISEAVLKAAYAQLGIEFETSWLPPKRALQLAGTGKSDGEISRTGTIAKKYPDLIQVKIPVNHVDGMAFTKNKTLQIKNWESLRPLKIGINRGMIFSVNATKGMNVEVVNNFPALFKMLDLERVDVIISTRAIGLYLNIKQDLKNIVINEPPLITFNLYHFLHKRHSKLATRLEAVLKKMKESGEIDRIRSNYIQDLKKGIIHERSK